MDENKNWINYKSFDAYSQLEFCGKSESGIYNYTFEKAGLYIYIQGGHGSSLTVNNCTAIKNNIVFNVSGGSKYGSCISFLAEPGDTLGTSYVSGYTAGCAMFYVGSYSSVSVATRIFKYDAPGSLAFTDCVDHVMIGWNSATTTRSISYTCTTNQHFSDGVSYICCSTANETGSVSVDMISGGYATCQILDLQLIH